MNRSFTVETRGQAVAIFGGKNVLVSALIQEFVAQGVHALALSTPEELEELKKTHDPDYLVVFLDKDYAHLEPTFQSLIDSGESRLVTVRHLNSKDGTIHVSQISKSIYYSDYIGDHEIESQIIEGWLKTIYQNHTLVVPGDGLSEISILGLDDLSKLIALSVLQPVTSKSEIIMLGNPTPISLLNLAYLIRTHLAFKISLTFAAENASEIWPYDADTLQQSLDKLSSTLTDDPESSLKFYLKSWSGHLLPESLPEPVPPTVVVDLTPENIQNIEPVLPKLTLPIKPTGTLENRSTGIPTPNPKRLTPLKTTQPFFVPLQERKPKNLRELKLKLPTFPKKQKHLGPPRLRTIVGRGLLIAIALYLGTIAFSVTIASLSLTRIYASLSSNKLPSPNKLNEFSVTYLRANWLVLTSFPLLAERQSVSDLNLILDAYIQGLKVFKTAESLSQSAQDLTSYIFGSGSTDIAAVISLSRIQAEEFYSQLSLLDGSLPLEAPSILPAKYQTNYGEVKLQLAKLKRSVTTTKALLATAPDLIGIGARRKYAVLFQNNMELRATGGFIGSFAILSFENGKLYDMPIYDVYDADGQLKGHVEPPAAIKDILGEANWYLRDSNFDPDFPTSARRAEWFIKKSLNQDLDGTIAVNVSTLVSLLKALGPITVPDYNETITGDNLYERAQFHAEVNFFPGSTQKKEFLSTVANSLFTELPTLTGDVGMKVLEALGTTIQEKNTLISLTSPGTEHIFQTLGWNGHLSDLPCPTSQNCHKDYVMVVDSNFGVNKANYFIKRHIEEVITFDKNLSINHVLRIGYHNTSTSTAWPAGTYKNYQRIYLPVGSNLAQIKIGDTPLSSKEYTITSEHDKIVLSYLVTVPINDKTVVAIQYSTPQLPQENELLYTWYWQKQPGTSSSDDLTVYLNYPMYLKPLIVSPEAETSSQQLKFNMVNDTDRRITVKFTK